MQRQSIRIGTWNIASNRNFSAIFERVAKLDVDVCALQEVTIESSADVLTVLERQPESAAKYALHFASAFSVRSAAENGWKSYGLALLCRLPVGHTASLRLGPDKLSAIPNIESEPRILQVAYLERERLLIGNTHLAATEDWSLSHVRRSQARNISSMLKLSAAQHAVILCGDFNADPASSDLTELRQALPNDYSSAQSTFVSEPGRAPIDFFLSSRPIQIDVAVHSSEGLSDHDIVVGTVMAEAGSWAAYPQNPASFDS